MEEGQCQMPITIYGTVRGGGGCHKSSNCNEKKIATNDPHCNYQHDSKYVPN